MKSSTIAHGWFFYAAVAIAGGILLSKLFLVQVVHGQDYRDQAQRQYVTPSGGVFDRGTIFFTASDGTRLAAATVKSGFTLAVNPEKVIDPQAAYDQISKIITLDKTAFITKASKINDPYEEITKHVSKDDGAKIAALKIPGVVLARDRWRFYPAGTTASHVLGFVGYASDGKTLTGQYGLERSYNDVLTRESAALNINFFAEVFSNIGSSLLMSSNEHEGDIVTTIEPTVQDFLETQIKDTNKKWHSQFSGGLIINPKNGEIYAMANTPAFDPNNYSKVGNLSAYVNKNVESVYEMGSIVKALTMTAGLDAGAVKPSDTYNDTGTDIIDGRKVSNYDFRARGITNMQTILNESLNLGAIYVMRQLGEDRFRNYMLEVYHLGDKTGIDLPNEQPGLVSNLYTDSEIGYATAAFGQGIAMTPVATARALSVIVNGGKLITPHVVSEIDYTDGGVKKMTYPAKQVLSPDTSSRITNMLVHVFDDAMLGGTVKMKHYSIGAKTGTAQIALPDGKGYYPDRYFHTYFGYFPAYDPKFLIILYTSDPQGVLYASHSLTAPFMNIVKFLINYYQVPPDR